MKALYHAIMARARGDEALTAGSRAAQAQTDLAALLATVHGKPAVALGGLPSGVSYPCVRFWEDAGRRLLQAEQIGTITDTIIRLEAFTQTRDATKLSDICDCIELLFDEHRDAPPLTLVGDGRIYGFEMLTPMQGPFQDTIHDCFIATMAFRFVEARP